MDQQQLDLSKLARKQPSANAPGERTPRPRKWLSRYVLPGAILVGFIALLSAAAGRQLKPKTSVTVVPVIVKRGLVQPSGTPLFQAAGWIEPRPTAVNIAALAPGVIEELLVVEGQLVEKGQPIARLISADAEIAAELAKTTLAIREGDLRRVQAEHKAAMSRLEKPVHLQAKLADAKSLLAKANTELEKLPFLVNAAKANLDFTRRSLDGKRSAGDAVPSVTVGRAEKDHASAVAELAELEKRGPNLRQEIDALQTKVDALTVEYKLLVNEQRNAEEAEAKSISAEALLQEAKLLLQQAELNLDRCVVRAPMNGRILRLVAAPGTRVMGLEHTSGQSSSNVAEMYDPNRLQVRADVRLEDIPLVSKGAPVEVETASSNQPIQGRVLQTTSSANIQKNTLEVKVELIDPPPTVSPEMLVTATFLAAELAKTPSAPEQVERILAPKQLVLSFEGGSRVWTVNSNKRAIAKTVDVGVPAADGLVEIKNGLNPTDKLIASGTENLRDGDEVIISGEDPTIGVAR